MKQPYRVLLSMVILMALAVSATSAQIVDTSQDHCYDDRGNQMPCANATYPGQDAQYASNPASYTNHGDGTITDNVTGLMWQQSPGDKVTYAQALANAQTLTLGGYSDWRLPTITELYSLMDFRGVTGRSERDSVPYLNTTYFDFEYGDTSAGERFIDAQYWSSTEYGSTTMHNSATVFGVNFADGRIKGYPIYEPRSGEMSRFVRYVRGDSYGETQLVDNGNGTVSDAANGLMWLQADSGAYGAGDGGAMDWQDALVWCDALTVAGYEDWRLPDAKEMQSLVDYTRSPDTTNSAAIDPLFSVSTITNELGVMDYPYFWTSTTHLDGQPQGQFAVYIAFGEALGYMQTPRGTNLLDVHGAGAQRSDPKSGDASAYSNGHGPQGDVVRVGNYARCVRDAS